MGKEEREIGERKDNPPAEELVEEVVCDAGTREAEDVLRLTCQLGCSFALTRGEDEALVTPAREEEGDERQAGKAEECQQHQPDECRDAAVAEVLRHQIT